MPESIYDTDEVDAAIAAAAAQDQQAAQQAINTALTQALENIETPAEVSAQIATGIANAISSAGLVGQSTVAALINQAIAKVQVGAGYAEYVDAQSGTSDDAMLDAAIKASTNGSVTKPLIPSPRVYTCSEPRQLSEGLKFVGPAIGDQARAANSIPCQFNWTGSGAWWSLPNNLFDVQFSGFGAQATNAGTFIAGHPSYVLWTSFLRDMGFTGFNGVLGSSAQKLLNDAILADGWGNFNNPRGTQINIGGSDSKFNWSECLFDAPDGGPLPVGDYLIQLEYQQKGTIRGLYMTESANGGVLIANKADAASNTSDGGFHFDDCVFEGRNANDPAQAEVINIQSGRVYIHNSNFDYVKTGYGFIRNAGTLSLSQCDFVPTPAWEASPVPYVTNSGKLSISQCFGPLGAIAA